MRVAIVDDDLGVRRALGRLLRAAGHETVTCASGEELLALPPEEQFDCFLLDVHLGGLSGFELSCRLAARENRSLPTIFLTAHENSEFPARARDLGGALLAKPVAAATLLDAIQYATSHAGVRP